MELLVNWGPNGTHPFVSEVNRGTGKGNTRIVSVKRSVQPPSSTETETAWLPKVEKPTVVVATFGSGDTPVPKSHCTFAEAVKFPKAVTCTGS